MIKYVENISEKMALTSIIKYVIDLQSVIFNFCPFIEKIKMGIS